MTKLVKSPLMQYITWFDLKHIDEGYNSYYKMAYPQDPVDLEKSHKFWNSLFLEELRFREKFYRNVVFSIHGWQGDGKSASLIRIASLIAEIFGSGFGLENIHFFQENLEEALKTAKNRTVHILDEQPRMFGQGSRWLASELANFEDILRKPQISIGYASPSLRSHEHFFIFEAMGDIGVDDDGNPSFILLMLKTKRKSDGLIMPRGVLKLSWPDKGLWDVYNEKKDAFIKRMGGKKGGGADFVEKESRLVVGKYKDRLLVELKDGSKKPATTGRIKFFVVKELGYRKYSKQGLDDIIEAVKVELESLV